MSPTATVVSLIEQVASEMEASDSHYQFASTPRSVSFLRTETLPLQLLEFVNRGIPRPNDLHVRLRRAALPTDTTIGDLLADRIRFAVTKLAIEGGNTFVINLGTYSFACYTV